MRRFGTPSTGCMVRRISATMLHTFKHFSRCRCCALPRHCRHSFHLPATNRRYACLSTPPTLRHRRTATDVLTPPTHTASPLCLCLSLTLFRFRSPYATDFTARATTTFWHTALPFAAPARQAATTAARRAPAVPSLPLRGWVWSPPPLHALPTQHRRWLVAFATMPVLQVNTGRTFCRSHHIPIPNNVRTLTTNALLRAQRRSVTATILPARRRT